MTRDLRPPLTAYPVDSVPAALRGGVVAVGNFDGVHRGHAALLEQARTDARRLGVPAVVLTFEPHPRTFFRPENPVFRLTPIASRARLLAALGIDGLAVATFDRGFAGRSPDEFVQAVLVGQLGLKGAVVGFNFHFGKGRAGTPDMLAEAGRRLGFAVTVVRPVGQADRAPFASTAIREALAAGDIAGANRLLGYRWFVEGGVVRGDRRGRDLGFPTANIALPPECGLRHGIYAVRLRRSGGQEYDGVASFGRRPTFDNGPPLLEVHVFDFADDLYGETVAVSFLGWIRPEARFPSADALVAAMNEDAAAARSILVSAGEGSGLDRALAGVDL